MPAEKLLSAEAGGTLQREESLAARCLRSRREGCSRGRGARHGEEGELVFQRVGVVFGGVRSAEPRLRPWFGEACLAWVVDRSEISSPARQVSPAAWRWQATAVRAAANRRGDRLEFTIYRALIPAGCGFSEESMALKSFRSSSSFSGCFLARLVFSPMSASRSKSWSTVTGSGSTAYP